MYSSTLCRSTVHNEYQSSTDVWSDWHKTSSRYKPVVPDIPFADVVRANFTQKGYRQAKPLVGTQVVCKAGELLWLVKDKSKLSYNAVHYANQRK